MHHPVVESGNRSIIVFVTVCAAGREPVLANQSAHRSLQMAFSRADHWIVGRYVVMPDHVHLFCAPGTWPAEPLSKWVGYWKRLFTLDIREQLKDFRWQPNFWDTQLRTGESYSEKWAYVSQNPVRAGLVEIADDWLYSGELNQLDWHD